MVADARAVQEGKVARKLDPEFERGFQGSWSGYERDKLWWNPDGPFPRFFDAAYVEGLDFADDGRASVPVDVDGDGDLDLAMLSLQGLHLMINTAPKRHFARVRLTATKSHPLALGAVVRLSAGGVVRQDYVRVTDGFLSQVPADLHFGLGDGERIDWIEVDWPSGGPAQRVVAPPADGVLSIVEGRPDSAFTPLKSWPAGSIRGDLPMDVTGIQAREVEGPLRPVATPGTPAVLNFWSRNCADCIEEIPVLSEVAARWKGRASFAGINAEIEQPEASRAWQASSYPQFLADEALLTRFFGSSGSLPVPSTFIFDRQGRLCRVFNRRTDARDIEELLESLSKEGLYWADLQLRAQDLLLRKDYPRARELLEKAIKERPDVSSLWTDLGIAFLGLRDTSGADSSFAQAVKLDPGNPKALENYGTGLFRRGDVKGALEAFRKAARTMPDKVELLLNLGSAAAAAGEIGEAKQAFERACRVDPDNAEAWLGKAKCLISSSDLQAAKAALQEALRINPGHREARAILDRIPR